VKKKKRSGFALKQDQTAGKFEFTMKRVVVAPNIPLDAKRRPKATITQSDRSLPPNTPWQQSHELIQKELIWFLKKDDANEVEED
jgi:hypothetical protein